MDHSHQEENLGEKVVNIKTIKEVTTEVVENPEHSV